MTKITVLLNIADIKHLPELIPANQGHEGIFFSLSNSARNYNYLILNEFKVESVSL